VTLDIRFDRERVNRKKSEIDFTSASVDQTTNSRPFYFAAAPLSIPVPRAAYGGMLIGK
jgi:hypothetical protein